MRTPKRVKQYMLYALPKEGQPIYAKDAQGNIIYDTMPDGTSQPREVGKTTNEFENPVPFYNSVTGTLTEDELMAFGDYPGMKVKMTYKKGSLPFVVGTKVWLNNEVEIYSEALYPSDNLFPGFLFPNGKADFETADFTVIGIQDVGRHFYKALLVENA